MADVFVSYKAEDRRRVRPLVEALQAEGYSVWWDEQIGGGASWRREIEAELNAAKCVIVMWSKRSVGVDGTFVQDEATRAQQRHVYVPVLIDKVQLPIGFGECQALPLTGWHGERSDARFDAVLAAVRKAAGQKRRRIASAPVPLPSMSRRAAVIGGAAGIALVGGVGVWALRKPGPAGASSSSIAVLPFANLSGDPAQAYFSDGIAEEIRSALAKLGGLRVIGRTSSEAVRDDDAQTVARKLQVESILTGSVRQSPSTIRITAELVDGRSGADRWSQDYDRSPGDAIKIQTDIAENVARALSAALGGAARAAIELGGTNNPEAQALLLQALEASRPGLKAGHQRALSLLDAAIALDREYADAYAQKASLLEYYADNFADTVADLRDQRSTALQTAKIAMRLAPDLPSAHLALAQCYEGVLKIRQASTELRRALELGPGSAPAIGSQSIFLVRFGNQKEALRLADKTISLEPLDPESYRRHFLALFYNRRYSDALAFTQQLESKSPELSVWASYAAWAAIFSGKLDQAPRYLQAAPADEYRRLVGESDLLIRTGRRAEVQGKLALLAKLYGDTVHYQIAQVYAQLGEADRAFAALNRAWTFRDNGLAWIRVDPHMDPIRSDPRYRALIKTMDFPDPI